MTTNASNVIGAVSWLAQMGKVKVQSWARISESLAVNVLFESTFMNISIKVVFFMQQESFTRFGDRNEYYQYIFYRRVSRIIIFLVPSKGESSCMAVVRVELKVA